MAANSQVWRAAAEGNAKQLRQLLRSGHHSGKGRAKLQAAEQQSVALLHATNAQGQTLLHTAVLADSPECVTLLIDHAAAVASTADLQGGRELWQFLNHRDTALGWTALHHAIFRKHTTTALLLAARGAEIDVLDHKGYSPVDLAFVDTYPPPAPEQASASTATVSSSARRTRGSASDSDSDEQLTDNDGDYEEGEDDEDNYSFSGPDEWRNERLGHRSQRDSHSRSQQSTFPTKSEDEALGELFTWGEGSNYCLGHGNPNSVSQPKRVTSLPSDDNVVVHISTSEFATGIVTQSGRLYTCGVGTTGRLGHGDREIRHVPRRVLGALQSKRIVSVSMGYAHAAALADDGSVFTWGSGEHGQLGHGSTDDSLVPKKISNAFEGQKAIAVAAGRHHTVVLSSKGSVWTFGHGEHGELGYLTDSLAKKAFCQSTPRVVAGIEAAVINIAVGKMHTACASQSGDIYLFGLGSPHPRKLFLPGVLPSVLAQATSSSSSSPSKQELLPTPIFSISPTHTTYSLLSDGQSASSGFMGTRGNRMITSLAACGNMTLVVCNRRDAFLSDLYHVEGTHSRLPKPTFLPPVPGNNTIASATLNTAKEIVVATDTGHLWKCTERHGKSKEWEWRRVSVRRFNQVACSRSHYIAIAQKEAVMKQSITVSPWNLSVHLLKELEDGDFTDVEFVLDDGNRVPAHKIVLASRSQNFASQFAATQEGDDKNAKAAHEGPMWGEHDFSALDLLQRPKQQITISNVPSSHFHNFLRLVYSDLSDPRVPQLDEKEKMQAVPLLKQFGVHLAARARDKGKGKMKDDGRTGDSTPAQTASLFEQELRDAVFDTALTDVDLISSEGDHIPCHKAIICSQSEVLRAMMTIGMIESLKSEIFIQNAKTATLQKVKEFLYLGNFAELIEWQRDSGGQNRGNKQRGSGTGTGPVSMREAIPFDTVMELLNISNQFMLGRMKETLEDLLLRQYLDYDNFMSLLVTAENFSCYNLKRELFQFARRNFIALLMSNVARELTDSNHADYADLLDDMQYFIQNGRLREEGLEDVFSEDDGAVGEDLEINELLEYLGEEELQRQQEMETFWEQERQIAKEREKAKANEQRRRLAKARAKAAKVRSRNRLRSSQSRVAAEDGDKQADDRGEASTSTLSTEEAEAREKARAQLKAAIDLASTALSRDYEGNEEAIRLMKRLRAAKKKISQIEALWLKQDQGGELDEGQLAKLDHEESIRTEIETLVINLAEATRPPPAPTPTPTPQPTSSRKQAQPTSDAQPIPTGPLAYKKKPESDDFFGKPLPQPQARNRRRTNSAAKKVAAPQSAPPAPAPAPAAEEAKAPVAPWGVKKAPPLATNDKPTTVSAPSSSPQRVVSLLEIQQEQARTTNKTPAANSGPQQRKVKRLGGAVEKELLVKPQQQVGNADNESSPYAYSLVIGGKSATSPVRLTQQPSAKSPLRTSADGVHQPPAQQQQKQQQQRSPAKSSAAPAKTSPVRPSVPSTSPSRPLQQQQQHQQQRAAAPIVPPSVAAPPKPASLADIQREERLRIEAERKRREVVKPTKKSLLEIQNEQEEARKIKALYGEELKLIYGQDIDVESVW